jgi:hypothetical protein
VSTRRFRIESNGRTIVFATPATNAGCPICPDFLRRLLALIHPMRLSLMKGAHADLSNTAWQEIGVKPSVGLSGIMAVDVPLPVRHVHLRVTAYSSNEGHGFGRARQISLPMSALSVCVRTPLTSSVPKGLAKPVASVWQKTMLRPLESILNRRVLTQTL